MKFYHEMSHHTTDSADYAKMYRQTRKAAAADHDWPGDPHAINSVRRPRKSVQEQQIHHAHRLNATTTHDAGHRFVQIEHAGMPVRLVVKEHATVTSQPDTPMRERTFSDPTRIRKTSHVTFTTRTSALNISLRRCQNKRHENESKLRLTYAFSRHCTHGVTCTLDVRTV